jgi:ATP-binding cassette subfamily D (ALD) protein 3
LFRILGDLWPLFGGKLTKPRADQLFYVPQKPYLALGTLRDQVIYPHTREQAQERGFDDVKLLELLGKVHLEYLVEREGGWDSVQDWADVLSGGEKQR